MNNCEIHHLKISLYTNINILAIAIVNLSDRSLQLCIIRLISFFAFLFFYSSDYNFIKKLFSELKI